MIKKSKSINVIASLFIIFLFFPSSVAAQHFQSSNYTIDWGNFNITSGKKTSLNYSLTDTVGQNAPGPYTSASYKVKSGFQYIYEGNVQFSFSIDNPEAALGTLVPGIGTTATNTLTISTPSGRGYQLLAHYSHPLSLSNGTTIPDTSCDSGTPCTSSSSNLWSSSSRYGFGFNASGIGSSGLFPSLSYYRPFSLTNNIIASENTPVSGRQTIITYKSLISAIQPAGEYNTAIIFTAIPIY